MRHRSTFSSSRKVCVSYPWHEAEVLGCEVHRMSTFAMIILLEFFFRTWYDTEKNKLTLRMKARKWRERTANWIWWREGGASSRSIFFITLVRQIGPLHYRFECYRQYAKNDERRVVLDLYFGRSTDMVAFQISMSLSYRIMLERPANRHFICTMNTSCIVM